MASSCSSNESLPAIKDSQAESFSKQLANAACKRLYECVDEQTGADSSTSAPEIVAVCAENFRQTLVPELKKCERWNSELSKVCLKDMAKGECVSNGSITVDSCEELMNICGIEDPQAPKSGS